MAKKRNPKGLGHYYKKDNLFCWKYVRDGKPIWRSAMTERELQKKVRQVLSTDATNDKTKVSEYFENWLENYVDPMKKKATYNQYESIYRVHIKSEIGDYRMTSIKKTDIQKVILNMNKKGLSTKTMTHAHNIMHACFERAKEDDKIISDNPVKKIDIPIKQAKEQKVLSLTDMIKLCASMDNSRWLWSVKFAWATGIRRGELLALKWTDIDWDNSRITIKRSYSATGEGDTKESKVLHIALTNTVKKYLIAQMDMLKNEMNPVTINDDNSQQNPRGRDLLVFPSEDGDAIKPNTYYHTIVRYAKRAGIKAHPHAFRHTFTFNAKNKVSLKELQAMLGHDESTTTLDIYGKMLEETTDETAGRIDEVFAGIEAKIEEAKANNTECRVINLASRRKATPT